MKLLNQVLIEGDLYCMAASVYTLKSDNIQITVYPSSKKVDDKVSGHFTGSTKTEPLRVRIVGRLHSYISSIPIHIDADAIEVKPQ